VKTALFLLTLAPFVLRSPLAVAGDKKIPVILDTDIGDDIDDTWALGFLLCCPEIDVRLVVGDHGKPLYRARLLARFLEACGRTEIPVGIGRETAVQGEGPQAEWVGDYDLKSYPGKVFPDGVRAMVDIIMNSEEPVSLIAIGPLPNIAAALENEPRIAEKARFFGMHGSVRRGYGGSRTVSAEYNVKEDVRSCRQVFEAPWPVTITPLDTCGLMDLRGDLYGRVRDSEAPIPKAIIENYRTWCRHHPTLQTRDMAADRSSILFDTVAVLLGLGGKWLKVEELGIRVTENGFTIIDDREPHLKVATEWLDIDAFRRFLTDRLTGQGT
jgi:inosine-uridine nucleoside N-ribohydrolase